MPHACFTSALPVLVLAGLAACEGAPPVGAADPGVCTGLRLVSAGEKSLTAIDVKGRIWRWSDGRIHDITASVTGGLAVDVGAIMAIANQDDSPCFLLADGNAHCPDKGWHETGIVAIANERAMAQEGATRFATCFVKGAGGLVCGRVDPDRAPASETVLGEDVVAVGLGEARTSADCALKRDGVVWCRGQALPRSQRTAPPAGSTEPIWRAVTRARNDATHIEVAASGTPICARKRSGAIWCWNTDAWYDNRRPDATEPHAVELVGIDNQKVAVGRGWMVVLKNDGSLLLFGSRLGVPPTLASSAAPSAVEGLPAAAVDLSAASDYFCALLADGTAWCRGSSLRGQRGYATATLGAPN